VSGHDPPELTTGLDVDELTELPAAPVEVVVLVDDALDAAEVRWADASVALVVWVPL